MTSYLSDFNCLDSMSVGATRGKERRIYAKRYNASTRYPVFVYLSLCVLICHLFHDFESYLFVVVVIVVFK